MQIHCPHPSTPAQKFYDSGCYYLHFSLSFEACQPGRLKPLVEQEGESPGTLWKKCVWNEEFCTRGLRLWKVDLVPSLSRRFQGGRTSWDALASEFIFRLSLCSPSLLRQAIVNCINIWGNGLNYVLRERAHLYLSKMLIQLTVSEFTLGQKEFITVPIFKKGGKGISKQLKYASMANTYYCTSLSWNLKRTFITRLLSVYW